MADTKDVGDDQHGPDVSCYNCGGTGHKNRHCPQPRLGGRHGPDVFCYNCQRPGHMSRQCPQPKTTHIEACHAQMQQGGGGNMFAPPKYQATGLRTRHYATPQHVNPQGPPSHPLLASNVPQHNLDAQQVAPHSGFHPPQHAGHYVPSQLMNGRSAVIQQPAPAILQPTLQQQIAAAHQQIAHNQQQRPVTNGQFAQPQQQPLQQATPQQQQPPQPPGANFTQPEPEIGIIKFFACGKGFIVLACGRELFLNASGVIGNHPKKGDQVTFEEIPYGNITRAAKCRVVTGDGDEQQPRPTVHTDCGEPTGPARSARATTIFRKSTATGATDHGYMWASLPAQYLSKID